jgi:excisionase family DNA binding protein
MKILQDMKECAERLNVSRATLTKLIAKNAIGHYRVGLKIMFSEEHVNDYLKSVEKPQHLPNSGQNLEGGGDESEKV